MSPSSSSSSSSVSSSSSRYQAEAGQFLSSFSELSRGLVLDYSVESLQRLDQFIAENFEPVTESVLHGILPHQVGCYLGEVVIRNLGGWWDQNGAPQIIGILDDMPPFHPIEKSVQRFERGQKHALAWAYHTLAKHVHEQQDEDAHEKSFKPHQNKGLLGWLKGMLFN